MKDRTDEGLWTWRQSTNHNHMIELQQATTAPASGAAVELAYFGSSAFRITSPAGLTLMVDPWRNPPWGTWNWYLYDFPKVAVDIALSTHAHFDHDAVHLLDANVILDRLIGSYRFADVTITGLADKHVSDSRHNAYDWAEMTRRLTPMKTTPPDNWRSFDNCLLLIETGGLRILHWGDNRPNPPDHIWNAIGEVDVLLLPVDGSYHVLSAAQADAVAARLKARLIVPHHYGIWDVTARGSTLLPPDDWVNAHEDPIWTEGGAVQLSADFVRRQSGRVMCFGEHVAFEKPIARGVGA